jgi:pimeloyl-ACP methyl ester carboxylesterase
MQQIVKQINQPNYQLSYTICGEGTPVLLLHGYGEDSTIWKEQIEFLSTHCLLIVPDLPGSGKSVISSKGLNDWLPNMRMESMAHCMHEILIAEKIEQCIMLGHSMGGYITLAFATLFPEKLMGMGLVHSTAFADSEEKKIVRQKSIQFIQEHGGYAFFKTSMSNLFGKSFKQEHPSTIEWLIEKTNAFDAPILVGYTNAMMGRTDTTTVLKQATFPVLFVAGPEDIAAPLTDIQQQATLPNKSYLEIMESVGHMGMLEAPEILNQHLVRFIHLIS